MPSGATHPHLMLIAQVCLQAAQPSAVEVAQPALVGPDVVVPRHVHTQVLSAPARERALVTAEDEALKVTRQLRATHLNRHDALL